MSARPGTHLGAGLLLTLTGALATACVAQHGLPPDTADAALQAVTGATLTAPDARHWLGTDDLGRDALARLLAAAPLTATTGLAVGCGATALALALALLGLCGKWADALTLRLADVCNALPATLVLIALAAALRPGLAALLAWLALTGWDSDLRTLRARLRQIWRHESLDAARLAGAGTLWLLRRHALPALAGLLAALAVGQARRGMFQYAGLAFLGLADPRQPGWGGLLGEAMPWLAHPAALWLALPPAACLCALLAGLTLLGQGLEEPWRA